MLSYDPITGWLSPARQCPSPNHDERCVGVPVSLLVVHGISLPPGQFGGPYIDQLFCNQLDPNAHSYFAEIAELRVSAHALVRRDGEVVQYVPMHKRAWHAGQSSFEGQDNCNDFSIGIELEGMDDHAYEIVQLERLAQIAHTLIGHFPALTPERLTGHSDIAPGRKTDPGPSFDWPLFNRLLQQLQGTP